MDNIIVRDLDYNDNISCLNELSNTVVENKNKLKEFIDSLSDYHRVIVVEENSKIIGMGTIFIERKIIHNFKNVGHIEDIVIDSNHRGKGLGKLIINYLIEYGKNKNCYKILLNCNKNNIEFYKKFNFIQKNYEMSLYF